MLFIRVSIPSVTLRCQLPEDQPLYLTCPEVKGQQQECKGRVTEVSVIQSWMSFKAAALVTLFTQPAGYRQTQRKMAYDDWQILDETYAFLHKPTTNLFCASVTCVWTTKVRRPWFDILTHISRGRPVMPTLLQPQSAFISLCTVAPVNLHQLCTRTHADTHTQTHTQTHTHTHTHAHTDTFAFSTSGDFLANELFLLASWPSVLVCSSPISTFLFL